MQATGGWSALATLEFEQRPSSLADKLLRPLPSYETADGGSTMGRVMTKIKLTNNTDSDLAAAGAISIESVRSVEIEALVDTGATMLALPAECCPKEPRR
jgi:hypothetical protein